MLDKSIFRSYDIRGIYPHQLNKDTARQIGRAFIKYTRAKKVVAGYDMRQSSPELFNGLAGGIMSEGCDVISLGQIPIDCLYFAVGRHNYEAGIMVTASHNPKEYNGFKMVKKGVVVVRGIDLYQTAAKEKFSSVKKKGKLSVKDIWPDFISHIFSFIDVKKIKPLKVAIDAGNGMAGNFISLIKNRLPIKIFHLNSNPDGSFPTHSYNPLSPGATGQLAGLIKDTQADLGCIFDGDADRIFLMDEGGNFIRADMTLLMLARHFLEKKPGSSIVYNLICSKAVPKFIKKWGGRPIRSAVGFVNMKENMQKEKAIIGGELSGHYAFRDNFCSDSGAIAFLILLQIISQKGRKVSEIIKELNANFTSAEINFEMKDKEGIVEKVKKQYSNGRQDFLDGLTVEYRDWWFNLRPSQTEPLLRLTIEADNKKLLDEKVKELSLLIQK